MPEETALAVEQGTGTPVDQIPTDFKQYDHWRRTGELPTTEEEKPPAAAVESAPATGEPDAQAKTAPDSEPEDVQETEEDAQHQRPSSRQRKIDRLTRENADLQRRLEALEQRNQPAVPPQPPPASPAVNGRPELKNYQTLEDYTEALAEWTLSKRDAVAKVAEEKKALQAQQDSWTAREAAAAKSHPDYRELIDSTEAPNGPGVWAARQAMLEDDNGAEILYWLASRPAELQRIAALSPARAVLEVGKIAASLVPNPENPKPKVTSAPRPLGPLPRGTVRAADNVLDDDTARDFKRWERARLAQLKGK